MADIIVSFNYIKVNIPAKKIRKLYAQHTFIDYKTYSILSRKSHQNEQAENRLRHVHSILEKIMMRHGVKSSPP
jgi:hypothetical protein